MGLPPDLRLKTGVFTKIQDVLLQLGQLWTIRGQARTATAFLRRAQVMHRRRKPNADEGPEEATTRSNFYTLTQFQLAQTFSALGKPVLAAKYCAETLARQLAYNSNPPPLPKVQGKDGKEVEPPRDPFDARDWVRNCMQISDYFSSRMMFWTAEYAVIGALVVAERVRASDGGLMQIGEKGGDSCRDEELLHNVEKAVGELYLGRLELSKAVMQDAATLEERKGFLEHAGKIQIRFGDFVVG